MNDADFELLLYRILSGKIKFYYNNEQYELQTANAEIRYDAELLYHTIINDEKFNDWIRAENLDYILINLGLWTKDTNLIIKDIEKKIEKSKIELFLNYMLSDKIKKIKKDLNNFRNQLNNIMGHKNDMYANTLEGYASSIKNEYIICKTLFKNNKLVFHYNNYNNQTSYLHFNNLVMEINKQNIPIDQYKALARNNIWRSYWGCNKDNLFSKAVSDWTEDQRTIVNISRMYDNVYNHTECPDDQIIEDDDMLDGWMLYQQEQVKKHKKQEQIDRLNPKLKNAQEVFITPSSKEEISDIVGLNSAESLAKIKTRSNMINKVGSVSAVNLPDVQSDLRQQISTMKNNR